ncbi:cation diffusion facilitator family transporter [Neptunicella sp. SCSIO 80796]|uniref:cation diffusion facilitator family transporter n=1 Tax=Neptunicella plasticusilytica TaxID=3117012 RepID=UPI003A4D7C22
MHDHHHHDHSHASSERIGWAFLLNVSFTIIEFIGGWLTNSTAIMADAVHDLGDSLSIGTAWILNKVSHKQANHNFSYGYKRFSLLGALINGVVLLTGSIWVMFEAIPRLINPEMPVTEGMFVLAIFGICVNGFAAYKLSAGTTLNEKVLNWHLLEDVLGWVAVLIVSIVLMFVHLPILDPILSIGFTLFILFNVAKNLRITLRLFLQAAPSESLRTEIREVLLNHELVTGLHHLHFWSLDGEKHVLTAHLVLASDVSVQQMAGVKASIAENLSAYELEHTTIELEFDDEACRDASDLDHHH